jgi:hypothetical protein
MDRNRGRALDLYGFATMDHAKEWEKSKAGYLANYAEVGFNASLTAAMVAPNPVTIGHLAPTAAVPLAVGVESASLEELHLREGQLTARSQADG